MIYCKCIYFNSIDMIIQFYSSSFFPEAVQPIIGVLSNTIFSFLVKIKVCKKPQRNYDISRPMTITVSLPGTDPQDAERRRLGLLFQSYVTYIINVYSITRSALVIYYLMPRIYIKKKSKRFLKE